MNNPRVLAITDQEIKTKHKKKISKKDNNFAGQWQCTPLILALVGQRQRQEDLCECMASLVYIESLKPAKTAKTLSQKN